MGKTYVGERTDRGVEVVVVTHVPFGMTPLDPRHDLYNHSPCGFEYGYGGSGPAQLALAILAEHFKDHPEQVKMAERAYQLDAWIGEGPKGYERAAIGLHQSFKFAVIGGLDRAKPFRLSDAEVSAAIADICGARQEGRAI